MLEIGSHSKTSGELGDANLKYPNSLPLRQAIQKAKSEMSRLLVEYTEDGYDGMAPAEKKVLEVHFRTLNKNTSFQ